MKASQTACVVLGPEVRCVSCRSLSALTPTPYTLLLNPTSLTCLAFQDGPSSHSKMIKWQQPAAGASPRSANAVPDGDVIWVDVQVVRRCGAARKDELCHGQLAGSEHVIGLCSTKPAQEYEYWRPEGEALALCA